MIKQGASADSNANERLAEIARVVATFCEAIESGHPLSEQSLAVSRPDLMPELQDELGRALQLHRARLALQVDPNRSAATASTGIGAEHVCASGLPKPRISVAGYSIIRELGRGGQAVVLLATQLSTGKKVALKVMRDGPLADERSLTRFKREVEALAALNHPNIVTIIDTGQTEDGSRFISMHYIAGTSLDEFMELGKANDPDDPGRLLRVFLTICTAVDAAHKRGIIHRDLKPNNIRIDERGEPHILDFGLARTAMDRMIRGDDRPVSITGEFLGSLPWSSPEQAEGQPDKIDIRTDVYSLGVILYQMLTGGRFPYEVVGNIRDVLNNILTAEPTPPSKMIAAADAKKAMQRRVNLRKRSMVNEAMEKIVLKALAKRPERRHQSAGELGQEIARYLSGQPATTNLDHGIRSRLIALNRVLIVAAVVLAIALIGAVTYVLKQGRSTKEPGASLTPVGAVSAPHANLNVSPQTQPRTVDLMPYFDPKEGAVRGEWLKSHSGLLMNMGDYGLIRAPYKPPAEYDYRIHFTLRTTFRPHKADVIVMFPYESGVVGVTFHDGNRDGHAPVQIYQFPEIIANASAFPGIEAGKSYDVRVSVRVGEIHVYVADQLVVECFPEPGKAYEALLGFLYVGDNVLGVGVGDCVIAVDSAQIVERGGAGGSVTPIPSRGLRTRSGQPPTDKPRRTLDLMPMIDPVADQLSGSWTIENGKLKTTNGDIARIQLPYVPPDEYNLRVTFSKPGDNPINLVLGHGTHTFAFFAANEYDTLTGFQIIDNPGATEAFMRCLAPMFPSKGQHTAVAYVRNSGVWGTIDGHLVGQYKTSDFSKLKGAEFWSGKAGVLGLASHFGEGVVFYSIQVDEISEAGKQLSHQTKPAG